MKGPKVLHIVTFQRGGAGIAAMRLHTSLLKKGVCSKLMYLNKGAQSETVFNYRKKNYLLDIFLRVLKKLGIPLTLEQSNDYKIRKYKRSVELFSFASTPYTGLKEHPLVKEAEVINLHFVSNFIDYSSFFKDLNKPLIWTIHDMNPFQGGFHYKNDERDFSEYLYQVNLEQYNAKKESLSQFPETSLIIAAPSQWMKRESMKSEILGRFKHVHIPNPINTEIFRPDVEALENEETDKEKSVVLFVAESLYNKRKGFDILMKLIADEDVLKLCHFVAVGEIRKTDEVANVEYAGNVNGEAEMARLYNRADIFILPSREDNLPNSMVESLCCGTPVVGFKIGGLVETIQDGENGFLSDEISVEGLKEALMKCIHYMKKSDREKISVKAHTLFNETAVAGRYLNIYRRSLSGNMLKAEC